MIPLSDLLTVFTVEPVYVVLIVAFVFCLVLSLFNKF